MYEWRRKKKAVHRLSKTSDVPESTPSLNKRSPQHRQASNAIWPTCVEVGGS